MVPKKGLIIKISGRLPYALIITGCGSANCHNQATATGGWARKGLFRHYKSADTTQYHLYQSLNRCCYCLLPAFQCHHTRDQVWTRL